MKNEWNYKFRHENENNWYLDESEISFEWCNMRKRLLFFLPLFLFFIQTYTYLGWWWKICDVELFTLPSSPICGEPRNNLVKSEHWQWVEMSNINNTKWIWIMAIMVDELTVADGLSLCFAQPAKETCRWDEHK